MPSESDYRLLTTATTFSSRFTLHLHLVMFCFVQTKLPSGLNLLASTHGCSTKPVSGPSRKPSPLTKRERVVLGLLAEGMTAEEIALKLDVPCLLWKQSSNTFSRR